MKLTMPSKSRWVDRYLAAPSSMAVWPSWPQPCMRPGFREAWAKRLCSGMGSASMSARRPMARGLPPAAIWEPLSTPTTPVWPKPRCTSMPQAASRSATTSEVRFSWKASSGWAWMSRRSAVSSAWLASISVIRLMVFLPVSVFGLRLHVGSNVSSDVGKRCLQRVKIFTAFAGPLIHIKASVQLHL